MVFRSYGEKCCQFVAMSVREIFQKIGDFFNRVIDYSVNWENVFVLITIVILTGASIIFGYLTYQRLWVEREIRISWLKDPSIRWYTKLYWTALTGWGLTVLLFYYFHLPLIVQTFFYLIEEL